MMAIKAGKDVYCQKPLSNTISEGRELCSTVKRYCRILQTGSQQRSDRNFRFACELVRNGRIGQIQNIEVGLLQGKTCPPQPVMPVPDGFDYNMWLGPAPYVPYTEKRCHYNFRFNFDYSGGKFIDWGAHHLDIVQWALGMDNSGPVEIQGEGIFPKDGIYDTPVDFDVHFKYSNGIKVHASTKYSGTGIKFIGSDGWIFVSRSDLKAEPDSLLTSKISENETHLYVSDNHLLNFIDCIKTRKEPITSAEIGHRSSTVCHLGNISMRLGRKVQWNPETESFINDPEAERMKMYAERTDWHT
jgi:predicted dehydrogenase